MKHKKFLEANVT